MQTCSLRGTHIDGAGLGPSQWMSQCMMVLAVVFRHQLVAQLWVRTIFCALPGTFFCRSRLTRRAALHFHRLSFEIRGVLSSGLIQISSDGAPKFRCSAILRFQTDVLRLNRHVPSQRRTRRGAQTARWTLLCFEACVARNGAWLDYRRNPELELRERFRASRTTFHHVVRRLSGLNFRTI